MKHREFRIIKGVYFKPCFDNKAVLKTVLKRLKIKR
nr:MAG TPA: hypothetical protein [Caudoviricetes sp.]